MSTKLTVRQSFPLLGGAVTTLFKNPQILYPFFILAFIKLFLIEVLFFANRFPLVKVFGRIITRLKGAQYLHYPFNFDLINHWFQSSQAFIYLLLTSLFIGKAVLIIAGINNGEEITSKTTKIGLRRYINLIAVFLLIFVLMSGWIAGYGLLMRRAAQIRSTSGIYFVIKQAVILGAPYFNLLFSGVVTMLLAYVVPLVVLEKKNVFAAVLRNFVLVWPSALALFIVFFTSSLLFVPVLLVRSNQQWFSSFMTPESWQVFMIFGIFVMLFIDAIQYTAITTSYLLTKDDQ